MGDSARFEEAIIELDGERHPDCMFLMGSSLTSVIATDINGICRVVENDEMCIRDRCYMVKPEV